MKKANLIILWMLISMLSTAQAVRSIGFGSSKADITFLSEFQNSPDEYRKVFLRLEYQYMEAKDQERLLQLYKLHIKYLETLDYYDSLLTTLHRIRDIMLIKPERESLETYVKLATIHYFNGNYDSLVYWQIRAEKYINKESVHYGAYLMLIGLRKYMEGLYVESIIDHQQAATFFETFNDKRNLATIYNNLAITYEKLNNNDAQKEYLLRAIAINKSQGFTYELIMNYNNLGIVYRKRNQFDEALKYYELSFEELKKVNYPVLMAQNMTNRANILEKLGDLRGAENLFLACEQISKENGLTYGVMLSNLNLGNLYRQLRLYEQSEVRLENALELSKTLFSIRETILSYERLAWLARDRGNFKKAYDYLTTFHALNDSLVNESVKKQALELREKYELEKKENEINILSKERLYQKFVIVVLGLILVSLLFTVLWIRNKNRLIQGNKEVEAQKLKFELELKQKELLSDSIRRVSIMNTKEYLAKELKDLMQDLPRAQAQKFIKIQKELANSRDESLLQEFETRFLGVYESFFERLKEFAPELTPTELRTAAMIRLNFTSKEIAAITNRSIGTIDNLRSSIRKKLQMGEEENLTQKLTNI